MAEDFWTATTSDIFYEESSCISGIVVDKDGSFSSLDSFSMNNWVIESLGHSGLL